MQNKLQTGDTALIVIDYQERLLPHMTDCVQLEKQASTLIQGARILELPILVTQQYTRGLGATTEVIAAALESTEYIEKTSFSALGTEDFAQQLQAVSVKNVLVIGIESHICVQQTVLDLLAEDKNVYVAADACGTRKPMDHAFAMERMRSAGAIVSTVESLLFEMLQDAKHPKRKQISELIR